MCPSSLGMSGKYSFVALQAKYFPLSSARGMNLDTKRILFFTMIIKTVIDWLPEEGGGGEVLRVVLHCHVAPPGVQLAAPDEPAKDGHRSGA